ncbi:MAG: WbqC family protein [Crocinitomicaceae bacterium]
MKPILPITYFGNLEYYYRLMQSSGSATIQTHELYQKQTYRNRCYVMGANGILNLSVPVERPNGKLTLTKDVLISNAENWRQVHWKTLESCYNRTPYFEFYADQIKALIFAPNSKLKDLNISLIKHIVDKIGLSVDIRMIDSSDFGTEISQKIAFNPKINSNFKGHHYLQTFTERYGFTDNLSILDLLFNEGPNSICILNESKYEN